VNPGDTIARYRVLAQIGKGGMGVVYRAEDTRLRRPVALKFLPDSVDDARKHRFINEARAAALARHPNICPIYDIEDADGEIFIVMALIEGETLSRRIARGPIPPGEAAAIAAQVAAGLACAHDQGIVHRDIKSSNIMIDGSGHVSIMDFGLALAPDAMRLTSEGSSIGTPDYMSPEQSQGREVDRRTDLWSLGVVLFEMLTGALPFRREHRAALIHAILNDPIPEMAAIPESLQRVVRKALARDPKDRWPSANAMLRALKNEPESAVSDDEPTRTILGTALPQRRRRWPAIAALFVLLAAAGFGVYRFRNAAPPIPAEKHIAIIPMGVDAASAAGYGIDDALTAALSSQPHVTVVSSSELRRTSIQTVEAARKYHGANLALTWSARPAGDTVELAMVLVDAAGGRSLAHRTLVYDPKAPLVSRDEAVSQVFRMLDLPPPPVAARAPGPAAPEAYSSYLEGRGYLARYDLAPNIDKSIAAFLKATSQDANYALAYAGLSEAYWRKARATKDRKWMMLAAQNAEHSARLDPDLVMAHTILGAVYRDSGSEDQAIPEFQRALALSPQNAEAARQLAELYTTMGKFDEAESLYLRSTQARPTDWYGHLLLGLFYKNRQRYEEATASLNTAKSLAPDNDIVRYNLGAVYRAYGRYNEAIVELREALRIRSNPTFYAALGGVYFYQHHFAEAVAALETAIDLDPEKYWYWGNLGIYSKWAPGNEGKTTAALKRAIELAAKDAEADKTNYSLRASLAEYRARLGDSKAALAELDSIPLSAQPALTPRIAIVYELTGQHQRAVAVVRRNIKAAASLNQIKDDPDLAAVWQDVR
jgi:tetratricopeptide (TPR) repeat protein/predicted Ser/Thr protein kinase